MDIASLVVKIGADTTGLNKGFTDANKKIGVFGSGISGAQIGVAAIVTTVLGIGAAAIQSAVEWESAFAGVTKTVDGSAEQLSLLENQLRDMATDTSNPVAGLENAAVTLAKIAEMGGSLGIATEDLGAFTQTIAELDMTTDLTAESAATMLAQFANITGMPVEDYDNFGSALVDLGNKMAATEPQILEFAQRMAGAGERAGLSQAEILGFAGAMASLGLESEAGGTAFSQTMNTIVEAVGRGGPELDALALAAGTSASAFRDNWESDPAGTFLAFLEGLGAMAPADQLAALDELGLSGIRVSDALSRMSGNTELVAQGLDVANTAWTENNALQKEAETRFATTEAQMNLLGNNVKELGMQLGEALLPILNDIITGVTGFVSAITDGDLETVINDIIGLAEGIVNVNLEALGLDTIEIPDFASALTGWQTFADSLGTIVSFIGDQIGDTFDNIAVGIRSFIRDITESVDRVKLALADVALAINGGDTVASQNKFSATAGIQGSETAKNLEKQINDSLVAGNLNIDVSQFVTSDPAAIAKKIADPTLIQDALTQALAEGDEAAIGILLPIATELGIDTQSIVDQFADSLVLAGDAQTYLANLVADVTVGAGTVNLGPLRGAINDAIAKGGLAGGVPSQGLGGGAATAVPHLATGGSILSDGLAYLHAGEVVFNERQQANSGGGGGGNVINFSPTASVDTIIAELQRRGIYLTPGNNAA